MEKSESDSDKVNQDYVGMDYNEERSNHGIEYQLKI